MEIYGFKTEELLEALNKKGTNLPELLEQLHVEMADNNTSVRWNKKCDYMLHYKYILFLFFSFSSVMNYAHL